MPLVTGVRDNSYLYMNFDSDISGNIPGIVTTTGANASISTTVTKVGSGSLSLANAVVSLNKEQKSLLDFGVNDFTISFWVYLNATPPSSGGLLSISYYNSYAGLAIVTSGTNVPLLYMSSLGTSWNITNGLGMGGAIPLSTWTHIEIMRSANVFKVYRNGVMATTTTSTLPLWYNPSSSISNNIGMWLNYANCYIDELLILNGKCLHDENFTPTTESYTFTSTPHLDVPGYEFSEEESSDRSSLKPSYEVGDIDPLGDLTRKVKNVIRAEQLEGVGSFARKVKPVIRVEQLEGVGLRTQGIRELNSQSIGDIQEQGSRSADRGGYHALDLDNSTRLSTIRPAVELAVFDFDSNIANRFKLLVTPTHQHKNQVVTVRSTAVESPPPSGRYQVTIGSTVYIPYAESTSDVSIVEFTINPDNLTVGVNVCRIEYTGSIPGYLEFKITKEALKRELVNRTFLSYDGGYESEGMMLNGSPVSIVNKYTPDYTVSNLGSGKKFVIKLGNYTEKVEVL